MFWDLPCSCKNSVLHLSCRCYYIYIYIFSFFLNLFTFLPLDLIVLYEYCCLGGKRHLVCKKSLENAGIWSFRWLLKNWSYVFVTVQCMDDVNKEQCLHHTEMYTVSHKKFATWYLCSACTIQKCTPWAIKKFATWYLFVTFIDVDKFSKKFLVFLPVNLPPPSPPVGHIWDVMLVWRKGNINENCLGATVLCTIIMVHNDTSSSYRSVDCIGLWSCLV